MFMQLRSASRKLSPPYQLVRVKGMDRIWCLVAEDIEGPGIWLHRATKKGMPDRRRFCYAMQFRRDDLEEDFEHQ